MIRRFLRTTVDVKLRGCITLCMTVLWICVFFSSCANQEILSGHVPLAEMGESRTAIYAMVTKEKHNPYMLRMYEGFEAACTEIGVDAELWGPESYSAQEQIEIVEALIEKKVHVIAITANHADMLSEVLQKAMQAGICVVSLDSSVHPDSRVLHIQQADPEIVGRVLLQSAHKMAGGKGVAGIITSTQYATNQNLWLEWMKREYKDNPEKYAGFVLLEERYGEDSVEKTRAQTTALLEEYPALDVIITPSAVSMPIVGEVIKQQRAQTVFTGLGLPSGMAEYIYAGSCPWMYLWNPVDLGYLAAYAANAVNTGDIAPSMGDSFPAGRLGSRSVDNGDDGGLEVLLGNPMKFDKDNINQWKSVY